MTAHPRSILAIESAIAGGSLSLIEGGTEIARWIGNGHVTRAEELVENIDQLFKANNIGPDTIDRVAVSAGPGSFTGIRIGIATALGFKNGLGIQMSSISVLRAMVLAMEDVDRELRIIAAVPVGRDRICFQSFQRTRESVAETGEPETLSREKFDRYMRAGAEQRFVLHQTLYERNSDWQHVVNFGDNLAYAVGLACRMKPAEITKPLFVSKGT